MAYYAILKNESLLRSGKFFAEFKDEEDYKNTISKRKYLQVIKAPATEKDFLEMIGVKSLEECPEMHF